MNVGFSNREISPQRLADRVRIVLVEPGDSLNIGAVARAMMNLGFSDLRLVAPRHFSVRKAQTTACWASPLLESVRVYDELAPALTDAHEVVGLSAREGKNRGRHLLLGDWVTRAAEGGAESIALLFGPEEGGLTHAHAEHCRYLVRIPSAAENPAFNLSQAVLLVLYELYTRYGSDVPDLTQNSQAQNSLPQWEQFYHLDRLVFECGEKSGFFREGTPATSRRLLKGIFRRADIDAREMGLLLALFSRISRSL